MLGFAQESKRNICTIVIMLGYASSKLKENTRIIFMVSMSDENKND